MVWVFRISLGLMILAYVAWQAWPVADLLSQGANASDVWALAGGASIPGAVTAAAWIAVILLYAVSGVLTAAGLSWAPGAWFLAFGGEILLRLDLSPTGVPPLIDMASRAAEVFRLAGVGLDPAPLSMAALLGVGLLVVALGAWRGWKGAALTRSWAVLPVWG